MIKRTRKRLKIPILALVCLLPVLSAKAQAPADILVHADSMYAEGRLVKALTEYQYLYHEAGLYTPSMLLKMAYINERKRNYAETLYFLNVYFMETRDRDVLPKISALAEERSLLGYGQTDAGYFRNMIYANWPQLRFVYICVIAVCFGLVVYTRLVRKQRPRVLAGVMVILLWGYFASGQISWFNEAIIAENQTVMMSAPSSASNKVSILTKGHKLELLDQKDVWWKVRWEKDGVEEEGYIREHQLLLIKNGA